VKALANLLAAVAAVRAFFPAVAHPTDPVRNAPTFLGQHYNPEGNARRKAKARIGARQYRKLVKAARRERKETPNG